MKHAVACPCGSEQPYAQCCQPFHRGDREAATPEALMRSRFAAFALCNVEYLWRTLDAAHEDRSRRRDEALASLRDAARRHRYVELHVLDTAGPDAEGVAEVLFCAGVFDKGRDRSFVERSRFLHDGVGWRYAWGESRPVSLRDRAWADWRIATFAPGK